MPRPRSQTSEHADFYASPAIYDILHTPGTAEEVAALERLARRLLPQRAQSVSDGSSRTAVRARRSRASTASVPLVILEPACGTGRYLRALAAHGHTAIGFDRDPGMVAYAAARLSRFPNAFVFRGDMECFANADAGPEEALHPREGRRRSGSKRQGSTNPGLRRRAFSAPASITAAFQSGCLAPGSIDLAFTPINSIRHLPSDSAMLAHFGQIARVLKPAGVYAVGISLTAYGIEQTSEDLWQGARGPCRVRQLVQYLPAAGGTGRHARDETVISHMTVRTPGRTRHIDSTYALRAYDLHQWRRLLARSPLEIAAIVDESGRDFTPAPPGYAVFILNQRQ